MKIELITLFNYVIVSLTMALVIIVLFILYHRWSRKKRLSKRLMHSNTPAQEKEKATSTTLRTTPIKKFEAFNRIDNQLATQINTLQKNKPNTLFSIIDRKLSNKK